LSERSWGPSPFGGAAYHGEVTSSDILEVEWQFAVQDAAGVAAWLDSARVPGYTVRRQATKELHDTYFDTPAWRIHAAGYTCRVRNKGSSSELTLKSMAEAVDAIRSRRELTETLPPGVAVAPVQAGGPCGQLIRIAAGRQPVAPIFSLHTHREIFALGDGSAEVGEIAVDTTTVPVGEEPPVRFSRVEVEVEAAAVPRARRFVELLIAAGSLSPAGTSKFEAALEATGQHVPPPPALGSAEVNVAQTAAETAYAILRRQFAIFLANEAGTRVGEDIEALHDMRVASRRMRAAMNAFAPYLPPRLQSLRAQLGWIAAALGVVRDLDVQIERIPEWRAGFNAAQGEAIDAVESILKGRREVGRKRMLSVLDSRRYETFITRFTATLRRGPARSFAAGRAPILAVAPELVKRRYRRLVREGDRVDRQSPPEAYHALRIDAKKLRYALEFVGPVYGKPATDFSGRVADLQDVLGLHQDASVAIAMLQEMAAASARKLGPSGLLTMGAIAERYRQHATELRGKFPGVYRPLKGGEWRRLVKLMDGRRTLAAQIGRPT